MSPPPKPEAAQQQDADASDYEPLSYERRYPEVEEEWGNVDSEQKDGVQNNLTLIQGMLAPVDQLDMNGQADERPTDMAENGQAKRRYSTRREKSQLPDPSCPSNALVNRRDKRIQTAAPAELVDEFERYVAAHPKKKTDIIQAAIAEYMERHPQPE